MTHLFTVRSAFLHHQPALLDAFFQSLESPLVVDETCEDSVEARLAAFRALDEAVQTRAEQALQDVRFLGDDRGFASLASLAEESDEELLPLVKHVDGPLDRALWVCTNRRDLWDRALDFLPIDQLATRRYWRYFRDLKPRAISRPAARAEKLAEEVGGYFLKIDGTGTRHVAEHVRKPSTGEDYFAVYVDGGVEPNAEIDDQNALKRTARRRLAQIAFVYSSKEGQVRVYTERDARTARHLFERFHQVMFDEAAPPDDTRQKAYRLSRVLAEDFRPAVPDPSLVKQVAITQIRVRPKSDLRRQIVLRGNTQDDRRDTFAMLDDLLTLPRSAVEVDQVSVRADLVPGRFGKKRSLSFDVCWPNGGNLHNQAEELQPLGESMIRHWGWDTDPNEPADAWDEFLRLVEAQTSTLGWSTIEKWPNGLYQALREDGILVEAEPATTATCSWCHQPHDASPETRNDQLVYHTYCPQIGRTCFIEPQRVERFSIQPLALVDRLAKSLYVKAKPTEKETGRVWRLGLPIIGQMKRPLYFAVGGPDGVLNGLHPFEENAVVIVPCEPWSSPDLTRHNVQFVRVSQVLRYGESGLTADFEEMLDELSVPPTDRPDITRPWKLVSPTELVVYCQSYSLPNLGNQAVRLLSIGDGHWSVPLTLLFQANGKAVWKDRLSKGVGSDAQHAKVRKAISRLNGQLRDAGCPLTLDIPGGHEDLRFIL